MRGGCRARPERSVRSGGFRAYGGGLRLVPPVGDDERGARPGRPAGRVRRPGPAAPPPTGAAPTWSPVATSWPHRRSPSTASPSQSARWSAPCCPACAASTRARVCARSSSTAPRPARRVSRRRARWRPSCSAPGSPGFGLAPDGVGGVVLHFRAGLARRARVRHNFWIVNDSTLLARPCGLDWTRASGIVLRTVATCTRGHHVSGGLGALRGTCVDLWLLSSHNLHDVPVEVAASAEDGKRCPRKPQLTFADSREPRRPTI